MVPLKTGTGEDAVCPICRELPTAAVSASCRHIFCRACLANHRKALGWESAPGCPICRKPCSEEVLGAGYVCQKKASWFCEDNCPLLCADRLASSGCQSRRELTIENAISH